MSREEQSIHKASGEVRVQHAIVFITYETPVPHFIYSFVVFCCLIICSPSQLGFCRAGWLDSPVTSRSAFADETGEHSDLVGKPARGLREFRAFAETCTLCQPKPDETSQPRSLRGKYERGDSLPRAKVDWSVFHALFLSFLPA